MNGETQVLFAISKFILKYLLIKEIQIKFDRLLMKLRGSLNSSTNDCAVKNRFFENNGA